MGLENRDSVTVSIFIITTSLMCHCNATTAELENRDSVTVSVLIITTSLMCHCNATTAELENRDSVTVSIFIITTSLMCHCNVNYNGNGEQAQYCCRPHRNTPNSILN